MRILGRLVVISAALTGLGTWSAQADLMGDSVTLGLTNFPGSPSPITVTLGGGSSSSGDVVAFMTRVPTPGGGEWDYFYLSTISGGPLAADSSQLWRIDTNFTMNQATVLDGIEDQWTVDNTPVPAASLTPSGFINVAGFGPLSDGYVNGYGTFDTSFNPLAPFNDPVSAGPQDFPTFVNPYSFANTGGSIPTDANGFNFAYHFDPVPEPGTSILLSSGLLPILGWRRLGRS
jgi:hypothetical protein